MAEQSGRSVLQTTQAADCEEWLAHDLLLKVDRCLMAHGVEGRTPFLDPQVARMAFTLPDNLKIRGRRGKWLLRRWLENHLPEAAPFSRKRGFTVPVGAWIAEAGAVLGDAVAEQEGIQAVCMPSAVRDLFTSTDKRALSGAWLLLFYALWHQQHMCGAPAGGTIIETLREVF
jgi:asparagine synthase (glutamine-hydrolysing)